METLDLAEETSRCVPSLGRTQDADHSEAEDGVQIACEHELLLDDCSAGEMAEDEWWDLEPAHPSLERGGPGVPHSGAPQHPPSSTARPPRPVGAGRRKLKRRPGATTDHDWEEARRSAWLRQMLSDTSSDEDEDEERYGRFAKSGRWMSELYGLPQHLMPTSEGEFSG
jgi:hypothetical protein